VETGPKCDILGDLTAAVRRRGLKMGCYYSLYEWFNPLWLSDRKRYVAEHMFPQFKDVVTRYQPAIVFSDGEWDLPSSEWRSEELLAWLFNEPACRNEVVVNDRWGKDCRHRHGGYYTTEYAAGMKDATHPWEESRGMAHSYGYNRAERIDDYKTGREFILTLIDLVSRGGNLLLDIGPDADGTIPVVMEQRLVEIGDWLRVNGEAIYGTRPWSASRQWSDGKVPEIDYNKEYSTPYDVTKLVEAPSGGNAAIEAFFTAKGTDVFVLLPRWPGRQFRIKAGTVTPKNVMLLGCATPARWKTSGGTLTIDLPELPQDLLRQPMWVVKISQ
jgi:alpha-L-fucosidase